MLLIIASTSCTGDEFQKVYSQIKEFILQEEKKHSHNLNDSFESANKIYEKLSRINSTELREFKQQLIVMVDDFGMDTMDGDFAILFERIGTNAVPIHDILKRINSLKRWVRKSLTWYKYLNRFRMNLDRYEILKHGLPADLKNSIINSRNEIATKRFMNFTFAQSFEHFLPKQYRRVKNLHVNTIKLKFLHAVYDQAMESEEVECLESNNLLRVSGYNVLLSNVIQAPCYETANRVEIFAWNKVFIDERITKPSLDMTIISPIWEVTGLPTIDFTGIQGKELPKADDSQSESEPGNNGVMGKPGEWGGRFVAFGLSINKKMDLLLLMGGIGGDGQDGGNGKKTL